MMRSRLDEQLSLLNRELIEMGALCEEAIALAAKALAGERSLAEKIPALERIGGHAVNLAERVVFAVAGERNGGAL